MPIMSLRTPSQESLLIKVLEKNPFTRSCISLIDRAQEPGEPLTLNESLLREAEDVQQNLSTREADVVDARGAGRQEHRFAFGSSRVALYLCKSFLASSRVSRSTLQSCARQRCLQEF